jgi:hypothetical protein
VENKSVMRKFVTVNGEPAEFWVCENQAKKNNYFANLAEIL